MDCFKLKTLGLKSTSLLPILLLLLLLFCSFTSSTLIVNETLSYPAYGFMIVAYTECIQQDDVQGIVQFMYCNSTLDELQPQPQQYNYIILFIGGNCEKHVLKSFIENEKVAAVLVLDNKNPTEYDEFVDYRDCRSPSNLPTMKQLQYMPTKNASIIKEELHNGDLVILTWEPNPNQDPTAVSALRIYYSIFLIIWSIFFIIGLVVFVLEIKRNKIRLNFQTLKLFLEYRKNFNMNLIIWIFLRVGILLIEIGRIISFIIPLVQNAMLDPAANRVLLYFTNFVGFSLFSILAFNWLKIALLTLQFKDVKIWQILKIVLIVCCSIVDLFLFTSIFSIFYPYSIHRIFVMYIVIPIGLLFFLLLGIIFVMIYRTLSRIQSSKKNFALKKITLLGIVTEIGVLLFVIAALAVFTVTPYQSPVGRLGLYSFFEFTVIFLLIALFILVGYQQQASQMRTTNKFSSNLESDQSHDISLQESSDQTLNI